MVNDWQKPDLTNATACTHSHMTNRSLVASNAHHVSSVVTADSGHVIQCVTATNWSKSSSCSTQTMTKVSVTQHSTRHEGAKQSFINKTRQNKTVKTKRDTTRHSSQELTKQNSHKITRNLFFYSFFVVDSIQKILGSATQFFQHTAVLPNLLNEQKTLSFVSTIVCPGSFQSSSFHFFSLWLNQTNSQIKSECRNHH